MDDLISRREAIERATKEHDFYRGASIPTDKARRDELLNVMSWLNELPSAEPKYGKWVKADRQQYFRKHYPASQCSICGWRKDYRGKYNYCPNCGAKMESD